MEILLKWRKFQSYLLSNRKNGFLLVEYHGRKKVFKNTFEGDADMSLISLQSKVKSRPDNINGPLKTGRVTAFLEREALPGK